MTEHHQQPDLEPDQDVPPGAPETGDARVDAALGGVAGLDDVDVDEHAERLGAAHAALQEVLRQPADPQP
ncbi:hypothetical protein [Microlunatus flavus]|uniref:Uncharacterized protein n=1 Tax=Microlunatus flavus TaxID=1036181 RepID=A0A1H9MPR0_9ACTN|nr:hypothetical protein [Microlunatus flavus]SER25684.1 hypothetical protein SAMN05421756_1117 [Microlunatus flavus]